MKTASCFRFRSLPLLAAAAFLPPTIRAAGSPLPSEFNGATPLQWSVRMAKSEMDRKGDSLAWKAGGRARWDYTAGLFTLSLLKLNEKVPDARYVEFTKSAVGSFIKPDGGIQSYRVDEYNIDSINPGKTVLALWQLTKEERYQKAATLLRKQLDTHPRTSEGGFWHKQRYPSQMWLDGIYMGSPFYAEYGKLFNEPAAFDDVAKQIRLIAAHTYDAKSGLYYHGWDESKQQTWANKTTGLSSNFWGRAVGWYAMALVDVQDFLPANHPARSEILRQIKQVADGVVKHQDAASGLWWQVMDQGARQGNYLEATASAMFVYSIVKAVNRGYLPREFVPPALKGYAGIVARLLKTDAQGKVSLTQCCSVSGLGYTTTVNGVTRPRDGSFEYYVAEPIVENDLKGVGPFILAGIELQQVLGLPMTASSEAGGSAPAKSTLDAQWALANEILARIKAPEFPRRNFSITDFGAKAGDPMDDSAAIRNAIAECAKAGGGRVVVPSGNFVTGPIHLKSGVNLHLEADAVLQFKTDPAAYLPEVFTRFEGMECWNYSPLIYAYEQVNIAVTGSGTLDGQASNDNWWTWKGNRTLDAQQPPRTQTSARTRLAKMVADNVPVSERHFGEGGNLRPAFIQPYRCQNVLVEGVKIRRSPMWEVNPVLCTNVIVRGLDIVTHGPNNDGCDPESCRDVLIENCLFDTGDDCIAIKSGRNNDGRRVGVPSENIIVRNCTMKDGHGGVTIGSEISGGCRNVFVENCQMDSPNLDRAIRFKSNAMRGGVVENIFVRNVTVGKVADAILQIDHVYEEGANGPHKPIARNIVLENITSRETPRVLNIVGIPNGEISGVRVINSNFKQVARDDVIRAAQDVKLENCVVERKP